MKEAATFTCFVFWGGGNRLALPASEVFHVDTGGEDVQDAPSIESVIGLRTHSPETCVLRLGSSGELSLPLEVGGPIDIIVYQVEQVLLNSATHGGPFIQAIIEDEGELILVLDSDAIKSELIQRSKVEKSATTKVTT
jgi:hypothetical protein